jgi:Fe-S cluster assembly scaffold protein SufB
MKGISISQKAADISKGLGEPSWMLGQRLAAARQLERRGVKQAEAFGTGSSKPEGQEAKLAVKSEGGASVCSLADAASEKDFRKAFASPFTGREPESYLLSMALFTSGSLVEVRGGEEAFLRLEESGRPQRYSMDFFLLGPGCSASIFKSTAYSSDHVASCRIAVAGGAEAQVCLLQKNGKAVNGKLGVALQASRDSRTKFLRSSLGGSEQRDQLAFLQAERGSRCEHYQASLAAESQRLRLESDHAHLAHGTYSRSVFHFGSAGRSRVDADAKVTIERSAPQSDTHLLAKSLLLSEKASSHVVPQLFVRNADVAAGHGSALTPISEEELFYLQSRGIADGEGRRMVLLGFLGGLLSASGLDGRISGEVCAEIERRATSVFGGK